MNRHNTKCSTDTNHDGFNRKIIPLLSGGGEYSNTNKQGRQDGLETRWSSSGETVTLSHLIPKSSRHGHVNAAKVKNTHQNIYFHTYWHDTV